MEEIRKIHIKEIKQAEMKQNKELKIKKKKEKMMMSDEVKRKNFIKQLGNFLDSPFYYDKRFAMGFIAAECRDNMENFEDVIN
jgi:hypothetical protein